MRHRKRRKLKLGYKASRRLEKSLCAALILHEKIIISTARAQVIKAKIEKLLTKGKNTDLHSKRYLFSRLPQSAARKVFEVLGPKYLERKGGYLRINQIEKAKDGTRRSILELV